MSLSDFKDFASFVVKIKKNVKKVGIFQKGETKVGFVESENTHVECKLFIQSYVYLL